MVQFGLLSDLKREKLRAMRVKRLTLTACAVVAAASILFLMATWLILVGQEAVKTNVNAEIKKNYAQIVREKSETEDGSVARINQLLTVQKDIGLVDDLSLSKPVTSRIFDFIQEVNAPGSNAATIERVVLTAGGTSTASMTAVISGNSETFLALDEYRLSLEKAMFVSDQYPTYGDAEKLFPAVTVTASSYNAQKGRVSWTINVEMERAAFDLTIVDGDGEEVRLTGVKAFVPEGNIMDSQEDVPVFVKADEEDNER